MNIYKTYRDSVNDNTNGRIEFLEVYYFIILMIIILTITRIYCYII